MWTRPCSTWASPGAPRRRSCTGSATDRLEWRVLAHPSVASVAAYTPDLMDRSKIAAAVPDCRFVARPEALVGLAGCDVVVVDLSKRGVLDVLTDLCGTGVRVLAYGAHVDRKLLETATEA